MAAKGSRAGAILSANDDTVKFLGYGVYEGNEVPPKDVNELLNAVGCPNPKITLDSGKVVWGCECWWGPEDKVKEKIQGYDTVVDVDIEEVRAEHAKRLAAEDKVKEN